MAIGPPYLGSYNASKTVLAVSDKFITFGGKLGFHYKAQAMTISSQLSMMEMVAKNGFRIFKDEPFFENILNRIKYENGELPYEKSGIPFWPKYSE